SLKDVFFADSTHGWVCGSDNNNDGIIFSSTDAGHQWQKMSPESFGYNPWINNVCAGSSHTKVGPFQQIYFDENLVTGFVLTKDRDDECDGNQLYKTTSSGSKWLGYAEGYGEFPGNGRFCILTENRIIMTGPAGGFLYSDDYGTTIKVPDHDQHWWEQLLAGDNGKLLALQRFPKDLSYNFYRSDNYGNTFQALLPHFYDETGSEIPIDNFNPILLDRFDQDTLWATFGDTDGILSINYSTDFGLTFHKLHNTNQYLFTLNGDTLFKAFIARAETEPDVYKTKLYCDYSYDGGETIEHVENIDVWNDITPVYLGLNSKFIYATYFHDGRTGFVVGSEGNILKTTDTGQTWENIYSGVVEDLRGIEFLDRRTGFVVGDFGRILKSEDGGETWRKTNSGTQENIYSIIFINDMHGWAGTESGIRCTTDGGETWQGVPLRYSHGTVKKFAVDHNYLYAMNFPLSPLIIFLGWDPIIDKYMYLLRMEIGATGLTDEGLTGFQPAKITLAQNYPNPFNSTTHIEYSIPKPGFVSLKIFNIRGQLVRTLLNQTEKAGQHKAVW
ncbi:MAG: YCF48-related protein, partial [Calditrichaceae bacterium]